MDNKLNYQINTKNYFNKTDDRKNMSSISIKSDNMGDYLPPNDELIYKQYKNNMINSMPKSQNNKQENETNLIETILPMR